MPRPGAGTRNEPATGDRARRVTVAVGVVGGIALGVSGDYGTAGESASLVIPAGYAFGIWGPIYAGVLGFAAHQARRSVAVDPLVRRVSWPTAIAVATSGLWVHVQPERVGLLPALMPVAATLAAGALALGRLGPVPPGETQAERWLVRVPVGLFTGWITLATAAAATEYLLAVGADELVLGPPAWAVLVLATAAGVAATVTLRVRATLAYPAAVVWGLAAVAVLQGGRSLPAAVTAGLGTAAVAVAAALSRRRRRSRTAPAARPPRAVRSSGARRAGAARG